MTNTVDVAAIQARPLFSERYGINRHRQDGRVAFGQRHTPLADAVDEHRCVCPGVTITEVAHRCAHRMTQEDMVCDECRSWCVAVDHLGNFFQLVKIYGAAK